jgi:membrane dipeptidase
MSKVDYPLIFDGHNDTVLRRYIADTFGSVPSFFDRDEMGHIDLPRARAGGLGGGFFAIFAPSEIEPPEERMRFPGEEDADQGRTLTYTRPLPEPIEQPFALEHTMAMAARLYRLESSSAGQIKIVTTAAMLEQCLREGTFAIILHFEGADVLDTELNALQVFHQAGLRSLGLVWSRPNAFAHGVPFNFPAGPDIGPGLTDHGKRLVAACNELGIMIDMSHLNEKGFWDVAEISNAPLVCTHSGAHAMCATPRNLLDSQLDAIAQTNGLTGVNFHTGFLRADGRGYKNTSVKEIVRHLAYIVDRIGVDHVALGSDFDGARMPDDMKDAAGLPVLVEAMRDHGFSPDDIAKINQGNWLRVLGETWRE